MPNHQHARSRKSPWPWARKLDPRASWTVAGVIAGIYVSRLIAESSARPWLPWLLATLILSCLTISVLAAMRLQRLNLQPWPLYVLSIYVIWPSPSWQWAIALFLTALGLLILLRQHPRRAGCWPEIVTATGAGCLYLATLAPSILPADAGEFQLVGSVLGIAHPPGYPLYTMLAKIFTLLPFNDAAYRVNLFGAACGVATLVVIVRAIRQHTQSTAAALIAAAFLGLCATFWVQSTTANIRSLTALLTALCLAQALCWARTRSRRDLVLLGLVFGLGIGHHSSITPLGVAIVAYALTVDPRLILKPREWVPAVGVCLASLIVLAYLPLRSAMDPAFDPAPIRSIAAFVEHVLALGFRGDMFYFRTWPEISVRLGVLWQVMRLQFGILPLIGLGPAAAGLAKSEARTLVLLIGTTLINVIIVVTYRAPQTTEYLMPSYVALALLLGIGLGGLVNAHLPRIIWAALIMLLATTILGYGLTNLPSLCAQHTDHATRSNAQLLLSDAPDNALILANWHQATPLWYLQYVEGLRTDVEVVYVYPEGATPNEQVWLRRIEENINQRPVVVTNWFYAFGASDWQWTPFHSAWQVQAEPLRTLPDHVPAHEANFGDVISVLGYQVDSDALAPGERLKVQVYWTATAELARNYATFVQLVGPQGVVGQEDIQHASSSFLPGEIQVDAYSLDLLLHTPPGDYQLITGFYHTDESGWHRLMTEGSDALSLGNIPVRAAKWHHMPAMVLGQHWPNNLELVGLDVDDSLSGTRRVYLQWAGSHRLGLSQGPWRPLEETTLVIQALAEGQVIGQAALPILARGESALVALDVPAGTTRLNLQIVDAAGQPITRLGPWHLAVHAALDLALPTGNQRFVPLGESLALVGLTSHPTEIQRGTPVQITPIFRSLRPTTHDLTVSVGLRSVQSGWEIKQDGTPGLGGIPTLKWLSGWRISDPHVLVIPEDAPTGDATLTVELYDAFSLAPVHVLDERLVRIGQGTKLDMGTREIRE